MPCVSLTTSSRRTAEGAAQAIAGPRHWRSRHDQGAGRVRGPFTRLRGGGARSSVHVAAHEDAGRVDGVRDSLLARRVRACARVARARSLHRRAPRPARGRVSIAPAPHSQRGARLRWGQSALETERMERAKSSAAARLAWLSTSLRLDPLRLVAAYAESTLLGLLCASRPTLIVQSCTLLRVFFLSGSAARIVNV